MAALSHNGINVANIYNRRKVLTQLLRSGLSNEFIVVSNPDHPLLIRGPDILVSTNRTITAIFLPLATERRSSGLLKSRLTLSRLALPVHTRCVLVVEPDDHGLAQSLTSDFADVQTWSTRTNIVQIASNTNFVGRHRDVPAQIVGDAQTRFANAMTVMRLGARLVDKPFSAAFDEKLIYDGPVISSAIRRPSRRPVINRETFSMGLEGVALAELSDSHIDTAAVRNLINDQIEHVYSLDNGIPYPKGEPSGIAVVRDWPTRTRDSEKLILAAAFGGWAFVLDETRSKLPGFANRLKQKQTL
jgi:hypothetical protein